MRSVALSHNDLGLLLKRAIMNYKPNDLEREILGQLMLAPELLESSDSLRQRLFTSDDGRKAFAGVSAIWADLRPPTIDLGMLAAKTGLSLEFIAGLTDGNYPPTPQGFAWRVRELMRRRMSERLLQLVQDEGQHLVKTGEFDPAKLQEIKTAFAEMDALDDIGTTEPNFLMLSDVEPKSVPWLWPNFIPLGYATLISGDPGSAKTFFCLDLAARLSRGLRWPDGAPGGAAAQTVYLTVEDGLHDTIRPRIDSLGGDPSMIAVFNSEHPLHMDLSQPEGLVRLEKEIVRLGNVRLVVVDPIIDFSGGSDPNAAEEVRALLTPLIRLASKLNFALPLVGHLNKSQTLSAIYRAGGSTSGWLGKCRASFMIFRDINDKMLRHVHRVKANLAPEDPRPLEFTIQNGRLEFKVSTEEVNIDEQLAPQRAHGPAPNVCNEAVAWLREFFADRNEIPSTEVEEAAKEEGISETTLQRAKGKAGFRSIRRAESGGRAVWTWAKPGKVA